MNIDASSYGWEAVMDFFLYQKKEDKTIIQSKNKRKENIKTKTKLHLAFTSVKYTCGEKLHKKSRLNRYQPCLKKSSFSNI